MFAVLVLFIITDSRTISVVAKYGMKSSAFSYDSFKGNLLKGLTVENAKYENHKLFDKAVIYWNPLTLINHKITITKIDMEGVEVENILGMINELKSSSRSTEELALDYSLSLDKVHVDINPYLFQGVKFSSFLFNVDNIFVDKDLTIDANNLNLSFNSDIVNVELQGNIDNSNLLVDELKLKEISTLTITKLVRRIKAIPSSKKEMKKKKSSLYVLFPVIKVNHVLGTLKPVKYGALDLKGATLNAYAFEANPYDKYNYKAKRITFDGQTNMALLKFKGSIKNSTINAKGDVLLEKELFTKYHLPLNYKGLKKLPSQLKLNHKGVWVEVNHEVQELLSNIETFNLDIDQGKHEISYLYGEDLIVESELIGRTTYANEMRVKGKTVVDFTKKDVIYTGEVIASKFKKIVPHLTNYLLDGLTANYEGKNKELMVNFESELLQGTFESKGYKDATLLLDSKYNNIVLNKLIENLDSRFQNEKFAFNSKTFLDFYNRENSNTTVNVSSNLININASGKFSLPTKISATISIPQQSQLRTIEPKFNFDRLGTLEIDLVINENIYDIHLSDRNTAMRMALIYNAETEQLEKGKLSLGSEELNFKNSWGNTFVLHANIQSIQQFLKRIQRYYPIEIPNIEGSMQLDVSKQNNKNIVTMSSNHLKYISNATVLNIDNIDLKFAVDNQLNIELFNYKFNIDSNPYLDKFYATKPSYFSLKKGVLEIDKIWINDQIVIKGNYNTNSLKGQLTLDTKSYAFNSDDFNLLFDAKLSLKVDKTRVDIEGDIDLLGGRINYEIETSGLVEDSDIIVLQDKIKEQESAFNDVQLYVKIHNNKPLHYYGKNTQIDFYNELSIVKSFNQKMMITGMSTITNGYYEVEDKRFLLDESHLYFAGDIRKPLLDIKANYHKDQYTVHVFISGTTDEPIVNFNSDPYLKQQEILSLILFDGTGTSDGTGAEAYTLLGGTFAKGLMKSLGINIDHFLLGTDSNNQLSLEIGKKISNNISLLYLSKDGLNGAKVRVEHSKSFETDIIIMPPNTSSIEFLYKRDH